jgi:arylsulfatase A-like enzyme
MPSGPYRGHKGDIWEGGHRIPLVMRWPRRVAEQTSNNQLVCLTDIFATCAEIIGEKLPEDGAKDSHSFLAAATEKSQRAMRTSVITHSVDGEFAISDGRWKLVFRKSGRNREELRGKPTIPELFDLQSDIGEQRDLTEQHPKVVRRLTALLDELIKRGASRPGQQGANDTDVRYDITQTLRWAPSAR